VTLARRIAFAFTIAASSAAPLHAQTNWRLIDTTSIEGIRLRVEVSSLHAVHIVGRSGDTLSFTTIAMRSDSLRRWLEHLSSELGRPDGERVNFDNAIALTPKKTAGRTVAYLIAFADSSGPVSTVLALPTDAARLARILIHAAEAGLRLTDGELRKNGTVKFRPVSRVSSEMPPYPESMRKAGIEDEVLVAFTVDTAGYAGLSTVRLLQGRHREFFDAVINMLPAMKFNPAAVEGHKYEDMVAIPFVFRLLK
jgi:TonB family protein